MTPMQRFWTIVGFTFLLSFAGYYESHASASLVFDLRACIMGAIVGAGMAGSFAVGVLSKNPFNGGDKGAPEVLPQGQAK